MMDVSGLGLSRVIDFSLIPDREKANYLTPISETLAKVLSEDTLSIAETLFRYLIVDEHTVCGHQGKFPGTLTGILVMTPIKVEAFIAIMAGRYKFAHCGNGVFLPKPSDVIPYREADFILIGAIGGDPDFPGDSWEMARYAQSFIFKSAWKRSLNVIGLTSIEESPDADMKQLMKDPIEKRDFPEAGYSAHISAIGPIFGSTNTRGN